MEAPTPEDLQRHAADIARYGIIVFYFIYCLFTRFIFKTEYRY